MNKPRKFLLFGCVSVSLSLIALVSFRLRLNYEDHLPPEQRVRQEFENNRADYIQFVTLLQRDQSAHSIDDGGRVAIDGVHSRLVPEYRNFIRKLGAKDVTIREDGSIEFALYGSGCAICSDSFIGVRYVPKVRGASARGGWEQTVVASLEAAKLPREKGAVATGLYVVPIEPEWFVYRFEYQE